VVSNDILWQKEALLNLALEHLPDDCDKVCWIDQDILYQADDWHQKMSDALEIYNLVQGFSFAANLPKGLEFVDELDINSFPTRYDDCASMYGYICGMVHQSIQKPDGLCGMSWGIRREIIDKVKFYDESIIGGADILMARAATYSQYAGDLCAKHSRFQLRNYFEWSQRFCDEIDFSIACIPSFVYHLWHGSVHNRASSQRLDIMNELDYDPRRDLVKQENGLWRVSDEGKRLLPAIKAFFVNRREDQ